MSEIEVSIIQKVKDELSISEDLTGTELYDLLHKYRSTQHPDKFSDKEHKKVAEEKFKKLNGLLQELANYLEKDKQQKKPSEIIPYQKDYEIIKNKQLIIIYEEKIKSLTYEFENSKNVIRELKREIIKLQGDKVEEKTDELIKLYKPSKRSMFSLGLGFLLTFLIGVLSKVDEIAILIKKYFPFDPIYFNYLIFGILVYIPIKYLKMTYEENKIEEAARKIRTPLLIGGFMKYLEAIQLKDSFTEMNVYEYLYSYFIPKNKLLKLYYSKILKMYTISTIDSLKNIFIYNLLNRQLISISSAENLDRKFKISKTIHHSTYNGYTYDDLEP